MGTDRANAEAFDLAEDDWAMREEDMGVSSSDERAAAAEPVVSALRDGIPNAQRWTFRMIDDLGAEQGFLPQQYRPRLVIIESPYAGDIEANTAYARAAVRDSLERGEYPLASHLLYPQPGILDEFDPKEREWGIRAGLAWREVAHAAVFYVDRGWSGGMLAAKAKYESEGFDYTERTIAQGMSAGTAKTPQAVEGEQPASPVTK